MSQSSNLFSLARSKLQSSLGSKDNCSLHKWVLLKNSIIRTQPSTASTYSCDKTDVNHVYQYEEAEDLDVEVEEEKDEEDSFMFPDAAKLDGPAAEVNESEAEWLDSLLESLEDEDELSSYSDVNVSVSSVDDDDDQIFTPLVSPASSSDDLLQSEQQPAYYPAPIVIPYPTPYPHFHPPLVRSFDLDSPYDSHLDSGSLPYSYSVNDIDDLSVPDAIEDTSDDESDSPLTPSSLTQSSTLSLDPASIPLPGERQPRRFLPQVYIDSDDTYFYPFERDPLPFHEEHLDSYSHVIQEC